MKRERDYFSEFRRRYSVLDVWRMYCPETGEPKLGMNKSPFREEKSGSFSVYMAGDEMRFKDHGCEEHAGTCIDFLMIALDTDLNGVLVEIKRRLGIAHDEGLVEQPRACRRVPAGAKPLKEIIWPCELIEGREETWVAFAKTRGWTARGIEQAVKSGVLCFARVNGRQCYVVMDTTGRCAEIRDIKRRRWGPDPVNGPKAYMLPGVDKSWLPGAVHLVGMPQNVGLVVVEGAPDLISAIDLYQRYTGPSRWVCAALLGSKCKSLSPECAKLLKGRHVRLIPDADKDGETMVTNWRAILREHGCRVDVVGLPAGADLTDLVQTLDPEVLFNVRA